MFLHFLHVSVWKNLNRLLNVYSENEGFEIRQKKSGFRLSYILIALGIVIMLLGSATTLSPMSTIRFGDAEVTDVPTFSATLIFIGIVIFAIGATLYLKGK